MTRLRVTLENPHAVDFDRLNDVPSVLGTATRGFNGLEVVFGPRIIDGVYHAFIQLTGIASSNDALFPMSRQSSPMSVQIHANKRLPEATPELPLASSKLDAEDLSILGDLLRQEESSRTSQDAPLNRKLLVLNGPNINMLGLRDEGQGSDFSALLQLCNDTAKEAGFERCVCYQSNHEGDLIDYIQDAYFSFGAILLNPGAYVASQALSEALSMVSLPCIEVFLNLARDPQEGFESYRQAIFDLAEQVGL